VQVWRVGGGGGSDSEEQPATADGAPAVRIWAVDILRLQQR
jgi:hypothetical protein